MFEDIFGGCEKGLESVKIKVEGWLESNAASQWDKMAPGIGI